MKPLKKLGLVTAKRGKVTINERKKEKKNKRFLMVDIDFDAVFEYWVADCKKKIPFAKGVEPDKGWKTLFGQNDDTYLIPYRVKLEELRNYIFDYTIYEPLFQKGVKISVPGFINTAMAFTFIAFTRAAKNRISPNNRDLWPKYAENILMLLNSLYVKQTGKDFPEIMGLTNSMIEQTIERNPKLKVHIFSDFFSLLVRITTAKENRFITDEYVDVKRPFDSISTPLLGYAVFVDWEDTLAEREKYNPPHDISGKEVPVKKPYAFLRLPIVEVAYAESALDKTRRFFS